MTTDQPMIHHIGLEVREVDLADCLVFWALLGWPEIPVPAAIAHRGRWVGRGGQQIHLLTTAAAVAPRHGHVALIDPDLDATADQLAARGYELLERSRYWGARRLFTRSPGGHRIELMSAPPT